MVTFTFHKQSYKYGMVKAICVFFLSGIVRKYMADTFDIAPEPAGSYWQ